MPGSLAPLAVVAAPSGGGDVALPVWLDVVAMAVSGAFGAAVARHRDIPLAGVLLAGVIVGLGGGMVRDALLGVEAAAIASWYYLPAVLLAALIGGFFGELLTQRRLRYLAVQSTALGLLIAIGVQKGISYDTPAASAVLLGVITASFGGAMSDVAAGQRATILQQSNWFLSALIVAAVACWAMSTYVGFGLAVLTSVVLMATLRFVSVERGWSCPTFPARTARGQT